MNINSLTCTMEKHQPLNKTIEGICMYDGCTAPMRIWCTLCLQDYHKCCETELLTENQLKDQLIVLKKELEEKQKLLQIPRVIETKNRFLKVIDQLEDRFELHNERQFISKLQQIEAIQSQTFTKEIWMEGFNLLKNDKVHESKIESQDRIFEHLDHIAHSLQQIQAISDQAKQKKSANECQTGEGSVCSSNYLCTILDHQQQQKTIDGICINTSCKAQTRTWCVTCLSKQLHQNCSPEMLLQQQQFIEKLEKLQKDMKTRQDELFEFFKFKIPMIDSLQTLDEIFRRIGYDKNEASIRRIGEIINSSLNKQIWMEGYNLLMNQQNIQNNNMNFVVKYLNQIKDSLTSLMKYIQIDKPQDIYNKPSIINLDKPIRSLDCSPICDQVVVAKSNSLMIYDINSRKQVNCHYTHNDDILTVKYSKCGYLQDQQAQQNFGTPRLEIQVDSSTVIHSSTKNGTQFITGNIDGSISIWKGDQEIILPGHTNEVNCFDISPAQNLILTASKDKTIRIRNRDTSKIIGIIDNHPDSVLTACFSRDGQYIISAGLDKTLMFTQLNLVHPMKILKL